MFGFLYDIIQLDVTAKSARLFKEVSVDYIPHFFGDRSVVADNKVGMLTESFREIYAQFWLKSVLLLVGSTCTSSRSGWSSGRASRARMCLRTRARRTF